MSVALVSAELVRLHGNVSAVARRFKVQRASVQELIARTPELQSIKRDAREGMLDDGESSLRKAVMAGEGWAVCFLLKTQGKDRGYVERMQHEHSGLDLDALIAAELERLAGRGQAGAAQAPASDPVA